MAADADVTTWLLDSDPALRWQVERDVVHAPPEVSEATRARVPTEGFGARLLALQDDDGQWAGGAYFPGRGDIDVVSDGVPDAQPWVATTWSLNALREWGVEASVLGDTAASLAAHSRWEYDGLPYWGGEVDCCANAFTLQNGTWLGADVDGLAQWFVDHQLSDGGWNCAWVDGSEVSSFHSTLNAIIALLDREIATGDETLRPVRHAGEEYLLRRGAVRRLSDNERVGRWVADFAYPARWRYSALRALDHFRAATTYEGTEPDARLAEGVAMVREARGPDGRWRQQDPLPGIVWFPVDAAAGEPSKWLTLQGTRVLESWDAAAPR